MIHARVAEGFFLSRNIIVSAMIKLIRKSPVINSDISKIKGSIKPHFFQYGLNPAGTNQVCKLD
jgi:hypothetical protein